MPEPIETPEPEIESPAEPEVKIPEPETFDGEYVRKIRAEAAKYRNEAKTNADAAKKLSEIEDANKSEQQRLQERAEAAEKALAEREAKLLRVEVAAERGLPPALASRLTGSTKEELEADAEELLALVTKPVPGKASDALVGSRTPPAKTEDVEKVAARIFAAG